MKTSKLATSSALVAIISLSMLAAFLPAAGKDEHAGHHEHVEFSSISYARFAHLGKRGTLGRYACANAA